MRKTMWADTGTLQGKNISRDKKSSYYVTLKQLNLLFTKIAAIISDEGLNDAGFSVWWQYPNVGLPKAAASPFGTMRYSLFCSWQ